MSFISLPPVLLPKIDDDKAEQEAASIGNGSLEEDAAKKEHGRDQRFKEHFSCAALIIMWLSLTIVSLMAFIWAYHFLTPWHFLDHTQVDKIQSMLFSGIIASVAQTYIKKRIS